MLELFGQTRFSTLLNRKLSCVSEEILPMKGLAVSQLLFLILCIVNEMIIIQLILSTSGGWFHFSCLLITIGQIFRSLTMLSNCNKLLMKQSLVNQGIRAINLSAVNSDSPQRNSTFRGYVSQELLTSKPSSFSVTAV